MAHADCLRCFWLSLLKLDGTKETGGGLGEQLTQASLAGIVFKGCSLFLKMHGHHLPACRSLCKNGQALEGSLAGYFSLA